MPISETTKGRVESYPYPVKEGQRFINLKPGGLAAFYSPATQRRKGIERLIYIITLAPITGGESYHTAGQN